METLNYNGIKLYLPVPKNVIDAAINAAVSSLRAVGFSGPSGVAKTSLANALLEQKGYEVYQMDMGGLMDPVSIEGTVVLISGRTELKPSPFLQALLRAQEGAKVGIVLDEINRAHPMALNRLFRALGQGEFFSDWYGLIKIPKGTIFISTANSGAEYTVSKMDKAIKERHLWLYIPRPEPSVVGQILKDRVPNISDKQIGHILSLYSSSEIVSVRDCLDLAYLTADGVSLPVAVEAIFKGGAYVANLPLEIADGLVTAAKAVSDK